MPPAWHRAKARCDERTFETKPSHNRSSAIPFHVTRTSRDILTGSVERRDKKAALWSDSDRYTGGVDAVRLLLLDAALSKHSLPWPVTTILRHPHTVAHVRILVGCANARNVVAGAAIPARERCDRATRRATSSVWHARFPAAIGCL